MDVHFGTRSWFALATLSLLVAEPACSSTGTAAGSGGTPSGGAGAGQASAGAAMGGGTSAGSSSIGGNGIVGGATSTGGDGAGSGVGGTQAGGAGGAEATGGSVDVAGSTGVGGSAAGGAAGSGSNGSNGSSGGPSDPKAVDVFLIGGQSNATGQGYTKNYPAGFTINTAVQLYHSPDIKSSTAGDVWGPLRYASEGADGCGNRFGPELGFGNNIQSLYPNRQIALIKHAKSGTNLVSQWAPGSSASDTAHFGFEFQSFVSTVDSGLKALRDKGLNPTVRGMLWQQGEKDADLAGTASADYGQHLSQLIARVREQWSAPDMLFIYGYVYPKSNYGTGRDQVRQAEANVDQNSGNALAVKGAFVVVTDDLELRANDPNTCYGSDLIHFGTAGQLELGKRMATKMHDQLLLP